MPDELSRLLSPYSKDLFLRDYWARRYLLIPGMGVLRTKHDYLRELDELLQSRHLPAAFVEVYRDGVSASAEDWSKVVGSHQRSERIACTETLLELYALGSTLVLKWLQNSIPSIGMLCRELSRETGSAVQANAYLTPAGARGFARHVDSHEVMALQIFGRKIWTLYPGGSEAVRVETCTGDLLYIPSGLGHEAASDTESSVHLTLGIRPVYAYQLVEELASLARHHPAFQFPAATSGGDGISTEQLQELLQQLLSAHPAEGLLQSRTDRIALEESGGWGGRLFDILRRDQLTLAARVRVREDITASVTSAGASVRVSFGNKSLSLPVFLKPALEHLCREREVEIGTLEGLLSAEGKVQLVQDLVRIGFLCIP
jgi:ribosomal protein L16 Arg81 hydroxylase